MLVTSIGNTLKWLKLLLHSGFVLSTRVKIIKLIAYYTHEVFSFLQQRESCCGSEGGRGGTEAADRAEETQIGRSLNLFYRSNSQSMSACQAFVCSRQGEGALRVSHRQNTYSEHLH